MQASLRDIQRLANHDLTSKWGRRAGCPLSDEEDRFIAIGPVVLVSLDDQRADNDSTIMGNAVVHFEIIGRNPAALKEFYRALFGWEADADSPVAPQVSDPGAYGFIASSVTAQGSAIPGGIGGGSSFRPHALFYVGVANVAAALDKAVSLGGSRVMGPVANPNGKLVVGHFADPEGNLLGVAGPA